VAATPFLKRRQQVLKPRNSLDMLLMLKPSLSFERRQHRRNRQWRGIVGSAGVLERGKGTGRIAWEPERSRSRPHESKPALGQPAEHLPGPVPGSPPTRERCKGEHEHWGNVWCPEANQISDRECAGGKS
jgi:hypothetical protein